MKFVIHHHTNGRDHIDLMVEHCKALLTWQISTDDLKPMLKGNRICARRIGDHRKEYLAYEGPISGSRGSVKILDSGNCSIFLLEKDKAEMRLSGALLKGIINLRCFKDNTYHLEFFPDDGHNYLEK